MNDREDKQANLDALIQPFTTAWDSSDNRALNEALYSFEEMGLLGDIHISPSLAVRIWAIVSAIRKHGFPDRLRM